MIIPDIPNTNPKLLDIAIKDINLALKMKLTWLNKTFGQAFSTVVPTNGRQKKFPAVYIGRGEYISVLPDEAFGNYSFFEVDDPIVYNSKFKGAHQVTATCSIIFWFKLDKIFMEDGVYRVENVEHKILQVLASPGILKVGSLRVNKVYRKHENIFNNYQLSEIGEQFLMYPYGGLRFECTITIIDPGTCK